MKVPAPIRILGDIVVGLAQGNRTGRQCPQCGGSHFARLHRSGKLQESILPRFHLYPWRCAWCGRVIYSRLRDKVQGTEKQ
jgi:predicted RNA-binding Zn-ribbon protein involved in translation (DUF1610 family)